MKKILALAITAALSTSVVFAADNVQGNVGDVTYLGNIVANSPMWQWTVNDYPGARLDAKPGDAQDVDGKKVYPLNGQTFIAVSGYLPSFVGILYGQDYKTTLGVRDITTLTDQKGQKPANITDGKNGATTFTISATASDQTGVPVEGLLVLKASEIRGWKSVTENKAEIWVYGSIAHQKPVSGNNSCFIGTGSFASNDDIIQGTATAPTGGKWSPTAFNAFINGLNSADSEGAAPRFNTIDIKSKADVVTVASRSCYSPSINYSHSYSDSDNYRYHYLAAAHVMELTPVELAFSTPVHGAWSSTLTVTAYTM